MTNNVVKTTQKGPKNIVTAEVFWLAFHVGQMTNFLRNNAPFKNGIAVHFSAIKLFIKNCQLNSFHQKY